MTIASIGRDMPPASCSIIRMRVCAICPAATLAVARSCFCASVFGVKESRNWSRVFEPVTTDLMLISLMSAVCPSQILSKLSLIAFRSPSRPGAASGP